MKKYKVLLVDQVLGGKEHVGDYNGSEEEIREELRKLQSGYCEGEKPSLYNRGRKIIAVSNCDYAHVAIPC